MYATDNSFYDSGLIENDRLFDVRLPPTTQSQCGAFEMTTVDVYLFACDNHGLITLRDTLPFTSPNKYRIQCVKLKYCQHKSNQKFFGYSKHSSVTDMMHVVVW